MYKFFTHLIVFILFFLSVVYFVFANADGTTDAFYVRFTTPKQQNLIIGSSRAAQGILPSVLSVSFSEKGIEKNFFNYSFTLSNSPYGPVYLNSIKKKLDVNTRNGIYIVTVDPWSMSMGVDKEYDSLNLPESELFLAKTKLVNCKPNWVYLLNSFAEPYYTIFTNKNDTSMFLHADGWLEVNANMDTAVTNKKIIKKSNEYRNKILPKNKFSPLRYSYLLKTINYLKQYGSVYIVRLPIHPKMLEVENLFMPDFNNLLSTLSQEQGVNYINFTDSAHKYQYTDGNHIYKASARLLSEEIAEFIVQKEKFN